MRVIPKAAMHDAIVTNEELKAAGSDIKITSSGEDKDGKPKGNSPSSGSDTSHAGSITSSQNPQRSQSPSKHSTGSGGGSGRPKKTKSVRRRSVLHV